MAVRHAGDEHPDPQPARRLGQGGGGDPPLQARAADVVGEDRVEVVEGPGRLEELDLVGGLPDREHVGPGGVLRCGLESEAHAGSLARLVPQARSGTRRGRVTRSVPCVDAVATRVERFARATRGGAHAALPPQPGHVLRGRRPPHAPRGGVALGAEQRGELHRRERRRRGRDPAGVEPDAGGRRAAADGRDRLVDGVPAGRHQRRVRRWLRGRTVRLRREQHAAGGARHVAGRAPPDRARSQAPAPARAHPRPDRRAGGQARGEERAGVPRRRRLRHRPLEVRAAARELPRRAHVARHVLHRGQRRRGADPAEDRQPVRCQGRRPRPRRIGSGQRRPVAVPGDRHRVADRSRGRAATTTRRSSRR